MVDKRKKKEAQEVQEVAAKKTEIFHNPDDRPKVKTQSIKCPYCEHQSEEKIKYSFSTPTPNLIECQECRYHFIVMQRVEIVSTVIEIQDQLERGSNVFGRTAEAGTREASM
jgi:DNA-directed RNA polymerase subunit RPC12/RpoP